MAPKVWANLEVLTAAQQNVVAAQADDALKPSGNLAGLASAATARTNLGLSTVAASGDYDDLLNRPVIERDDLDGFIVADQYGDVALQVTLTGLVEIGAAEIGALTIGAGTEVTESTTGLGAFAIADAYGNVAWRIRDDGQVDVPGVSFSAAPAGYALVIADRFGDIVGAITNAGVGSGIFGGAGGGTTGSSPTTYSAEEQARRSNRALSLSALVVSETNTTAARPVWRYSHVIAYGQSLSTGWEGWPALSATQPHDNLMLGDSDHCTSESSSSWVQIGTAAFNPLVATVESGGAVIDAVTVAAYSAGNTARGESPAVGAANFWRKQQLAWRGLASDSTRQLVVSSCGVGGKTIAQLTSGASPNLFNRMVGAATIAEGLASGAGATYGVSAILFLQGENDAIDGATDKDTYKAALATLQADIYTEVAVGVAGQTPPPVIISYQTAAGYVRDSNNLAVSQAQLEAAQEFTDWYLAAPAYPVTDKSGHLDPNGYRWLGQQFGKVLHQVLDLGRGWLPVHPLRATWRGTQVLIDFHVPHPPLQFQPCYVATTATTYAARGFRVTDDSGTVSITTVEIVGDACVLLTLAAEPGTNPYLWYGGQTATAGNGNLCDSDPTVASDLYEYDGASGQYAVANIAALVDAPYPLWNWCVLFHMAIEYDPPA